jgi:hypothetical protein
MRYGQRNEANPPDNANHAGGRRTVAAPHTATACMPINRFGHFWIGNHGTEAPASSNAATVPRFTTPPADEWPVHGKNEFGSCLSVIPQSQGS